MARIGKKTKRPRMHRTSPGGRNHKHRRKTHTDAICIPKWGAVWAVKV